MSEAVNIDVPKDATVDVAEDVPAGESLAVPVAELRPALEAVLMVVDQPVTAAELATALELPEPEVTEIIEDLEREYAEQQRGFTLR